MLNFAGVGIVKMLSFPVEHICMKTFRVGYFFAHFSKTQGKRKFTPFPLLSPITNA